MTVRIPADGLNWESQPTEMPGGACNTPGATSMELAPMLNDSIPTPTTHSTEPAHPAGDCAHCGDNRYAKWEVVDLNRSLARENAELRRRLEDIPGAFAAFADSVCWDMTYGEGHTPDGEPAPAWVISPDTLKRFAEVYHTYPLDAPDTEADAWWEQAEHYALTGEGEVRS